MTNSRFDESKVSAHSVCTPYHIISILERKIVFLGDILAVMLINIDFFESRETALWRKPSMTS